MRFRIFLIIVLILAAGTPAAIGWGLRTQLHETLTQAGIPAQRIISVAGWRSSRMVFPLPDQPGLEADVRFHHGPYPGNGWGWNWAAARADILHDHQTTARIQVELSGLARLEGNITAADALRHLLPDLAWQSLRVQFSSPLTEQRWRGSLHGQHLTGRDWQAQTINIDWEWSQQPQPNLAIWLTGEQLTLQPGDSPQALHVESLQFNADWLEQGSTGALRNELNLSGISTSSSVVDHLRLSLHAAPLDRDTVHRLPQILPAVLQQPQSLPLQLTPLLALRPRLEIDNLVIKHADDAIRITGEVITRPGGVQIQTHGGGPESLYLRVLSLIQFYQPLDPRLERKALARETLKTIHRQGWLQRRGDQLRADIIINY